MKKHRLIIQPEAEAEVLAIRKWYEAQRRGLGNDFRLALRSTLNLVRQMLKAYPLVYGNIRQTLVERFPYVICYLFEGESVDVLMIHHAHRDPEKWRAILDSR